MIEKNPVEPQFKNIRGGILPIVIDAMLDGIKTGDLGRIEALAMNEDYQRECSLSWREKALQNECVLIGEIVPLMLNAIGMHEYDIQFTTEGRCPGISKYTKDGRRVHNEHHVDPHTIWLLSNTYKEYMRSPDHHSLEKASACQYGGDAIVTASYFIAMHPDLAHLVQRRDRILRYEETLKSPQHAQRRSDWADSLMEAEQHVNEYIAAHSISGFGFRVKQLSALEKLAGLMSGIEYQDKASHPEKHWLRDMLGTVVLTGTDKKAHSEFFRTKDISTFTPIGDFADYISGPVQKRSGIRFVRETQRYGEDNYVEIMARSWADYENNKSDRIGYKKRVTDQNLTFEQEILANPRPGMVSPFRVLRGLGALLDFPVFIPAESPYSRPIERAT